ncbi:MAG: hypothetical protein AAF787_24030 [Chloroflexota bacterium]
MSVEAYIRALPKVELNLQFIGAVPQETMLMFADQNNMRDEIKRFDRWVEQYKKPDFKKLDDLTEMLRSWIRWGDDLTRAVYDIGVQLSKDNVRYAEIAINPLSFVSNEFTFDTFLAALNDGRDRVERAWGVQMRWIMTIPRSDARRADDVARWATSATGRKGGVVGITLAGYDKPISLDQFDRAFGIAVKKDVSRSARLGPKDDIDEAIDLLSLQSVIDGWGLIESPQTMEAMKAQEVTLNIGVARARAYGWINKAADLPLTQLMDGGLTLTVGTDMPTIFGTSLSNEYLALVENDLATVEQIEMLIENALNACHLPDDDRDALAAVLMVEMEVLKAEHLAPEEND